VVVSSTFRIVLAERDELVKFIFSQLCEQCGAIWVEVDWRRGFTDEQKSDGCSTDRNPIE